LQTYLNQLLPGKNLRRDNLPLVTSLLSLLDFSLATGQSILATRSLDEVRFARRLVERAILEMIAEDEWFGEQEATLFYRFCTVLTALKRSEGCRTHYHHNEL
jgi:hypothetical protein